MMTVRTCMAYSAGVCVFVVAVNFVGFSYFWDESNQWRSDARGGLRNTGLPVVLWWTNFMKDGGSVMRCGEVSCYTTNDRTYKDNPNTKIIMFYGSMLKLDDLPLPRKPHEQWSLIHEESPKNNWAFTNPAFMALFNHTATFKRASDHPITLQWLTSIKDIESKEYYRPVEEKNRLSSEEGLAPIAYIQSDCGAPSDRDSLVQMLSKYIQIDCLGACLHNKDLPEHLVNPLKGMHHNDFYHLLSKYKFVIAAENAICEDYITEKLWRSFYVGTVPIIYGSPTIKDWLPSTNSAIVVQDYQTVQELVKAINRLQNNSTAYSEMLRYKHSGVSNRRLLDAMTTRQWAVDGSNPSYFDTYSCDVCRYISKHRHTDSSAYSSKPTSLNCPTPAPFDTDTQSLQKLNTNDDKYMWKRICEDEIFKGDLVLEQVYKNATFISKRSLDAAVRNRYLGIG